MRRSEELDPVVARELEELDAVLAGERRDPVLSLIADEARAAAPKLPPGLELRIEQAASTGFATPAKPSDKGPWWARVLIPAGSVAALLLVVVIAASTGGGASNDAGSSSSSSGAVDSAQSESAGGTATEQSALATPQSAADSAGARQARKVQRAAELTIGTPLGKLQDTSDEVVRTADRLGGFVERSDVSAGGRSGQSTFDLRIPSARLDEALASLSKLGHVRVRTQQSEDITERFVSARARLTDARAQRQALLRALAGATTTAEIDSINARLQIERSRIEAAKGDVAAARRTANLAHVGVTVIGTSGDEGGAAGDDGDWTPGKALGDAVHVLSVAAGVAIVTLAALVPAALLGLLAWLTWRAVRRRRRELALDAPGAAL